MELTLSVFSPSPAFAKDEPGKPLLPYCCMVFGLISKMEEVGIRVYNRQNTTYSLTKQKLCFFYYEQCIVMQPEYLLGLSSLKLHIQKQASQSYFTILLK